MNKRKSVTQAVEILSYGLTVPQFRLAPGAIQTDRCWRWWYGKRENWFGESWELSGAWKRTRAGPPAVPSSSSGDIALSS